MRRMRHLKAREIQGCQLALDASLPTMFDATSGGTLVAANGGIARWEDQSGVGNHVTQSTSGARPLYRTAGLNSRPSVDFDGVDDKLSRASVPITSLFSASYAVSVIAVFIQTGSKAQASFIGIQGNGSERLNIHATYDNTIYFDAGNSSFPTGRMSIAQPSGWDDNAHVLQCVRNGTTGYIRSDNVTLQSNSGFTQTISALSATLYVGDGVGGAGVWDHDGDVSEINVWASGMTDLVARRFGHSRQRKWGIRG